MLISTDFSVGKISSTFVYITRFQWLLFNESKNTDWTVNLSASVVRTACATVLFTKRQTNSMASYLCQWIKTERAVTSCNQNIALIYRISVHLSLTHKSFSFQRNPFSFLNIMNFQIFYKKGFKILKLWFCFQQQEKNTGSSLIYHFNVNDYNV